MAQRIGEQVGNYRLTRLLSEGSFASVYQGEHVFLGTEVALKLFQARLDQDGTESLRAETRKLARLKHRHIARLLDCAVENDRPFLVMDYEANGSLRTLYPDQTLPLQTVLTFVQQCADGLQYAREQGVIHQNLKPENILLDEQHTLLLSDFGLSSLVQAESNTQEVVGTIAYMAPEQIQGHPEPASDQYALGIIIYEWLIGARPFQGTVSEVASQQIIVPPPSMCQQREDIPQEVEQVVLRALHKDPRERFESIYAFKIAFIQACQGHVSISTAEEPSPVMSKFPAGVYAPVTTQGYRAAAPAGTSSSTTHAAPSPYAPQPAAQASGTGQIVAPPPPASYQVNLATQATPASVPTRKKRRWTAPLAVALVICIIVGIFWSYSATSFHQTVRTGPDIVSIQVGTSYNTGEGISGTSATFSVYQTIYLASDLSDNNDTTQDVTDSLSADQSAIQSEGSGQIDTSVFNSDGTTATYYNWVELSTPGVYTWSVLYDGQTEASITFKVTG